MEKQEIFDLMNRTQVFSLATAKDNQPKVRGMLLYRADENGIIFHTGAFKSLHQEIASNPQVELCFMDMPNHQQIRITGIAEQIDNLDLKKEIVNHREFLKPMVEKKGYESLIIYKVSNGEGQAWNMQTNHIYPKNKIML
jgi:uncharacterized pyridoxamine 5'-phosphate oxidase family protein